MTLCDLQRPLTSFFSIILSSYQFEGCIGIKLDPSDNEPNLRKKRMIFRVFLISQRIFSLYSLKVGWYFFNIHTIIVSKKSTIKFVYQKALIQTFYSSFWLQNNHCEFTTREYKFKRWFCNKKPVWNVNFKNIFYKIILSQKYVFFILILYSTLFSGLQVCT